jgi:UDP-glucose:(heptosyl)LPS alpha-1,3-glucosyltransferase
MVKNELNIAVAVKGFISTGGAEKYAVEVTRRLANRGHRIDLYAWNADESLTTGLDFTPVPLPTIFSFSSVLTSYSFAREAAALISRKPYDVVMSHERGFCQDLATVHTFSYRLGTEAYSFLKMLNSIYLSPRSWLHLWLEKKQMESPWLAPVSSVIKEGIEHYYGRITDTKIATPGVDIDWFNPAWVKDHRDQAREAEEIEPDEMAVLFVGSEFKRKGLADLIPAIGHGMKLLVVGKGERRGYYRRLAEKAGVENQILFKGFTGDVRHFYAAADVVVLPSLKEAFGMSILEAMACGLPVISSATTGVASLIRPGENGLTFDDPARLGGMLKSLSSRDLRQRLGAHARLTAENHTWEKTATIYEQMCLKIAAGKRSRS